MDFDKWKNELADRLAKVTDSHPPTRYFVVRAGVKKEVTLEEYNLALKEKDRENDPRSITGKHLTLPAQPGATLDLRTMFDDDMEFIVNSIKAMPLPEGVSFDEATMTLRYDGKRPAIPGEHTDYLAKVLADRDRLIAFVAHHGLLGEFNKSLKENQK